MSGRTVEMAVFIAAVARDLHLLDGKDGRDIFQSATVKTHGGPEIKQFTHRTARSGFFSSSSKFSYNALADFQAFLARLYTS